MGKVWLKRTLGILFMVSAVCGYSGTGTETVPAARRTTVSGILTLVGNEPFSTLIIQTEEKHHYILKDADRKVFYPLLGKTVTVSGCSFSRTAFSVNRRLQKTQLYLTNIRLESR